MIGEGLTEYEFLEKRSKSLYNRKCIDGKTVGCGKCVGYCKYCAHPGFLTQKQKTQHCCIEKACKYYLPKERHHSACPKNDGKAETLLRLANAFVTQEEDIKFIRANYEDETWIILYISIFGNPILDDYEKNLSQRSGLRVRFRKLNYPFEQCVKLFCGAYVK